MDFLTPDLQWYTTISKERGVQPRCPFATVEKCPRFYQSLSLLGNAGVSTSIQPDEDERLKTYWSSTDIWPKTDEQATSIMGSSGNPSIFFKFCPEVSFEIFGYFAISLSRYASEFDSDNAVESYSKQGAPSGHWCWNWAGVTELHYTDCPLYSIILHREGKGSENLLREQFPTRSEDRDTRVDRFFKAIKNHRLLSVLVIIAMIIIAIGTLTDAISKISNIFNWQNKPIESEKIKDAESQWAPAREIVVRSIAKTYNTSFHAATQLMDFNYQKINLQDRDKVKGKSVYLKMAWQDFQKLEKTVQLNNAALDSNLMPIASKFLESSENLLKKLEYYLLIHNDEYADRDFVSEPPFAELETIERLVIKLKEKYDDIFNDRHVVFTYLKPFSEIKELWEAAAKKTDKLFFQPSIYQYRKGKIPFLYDIKNLKALTVEKAQDGFQAQVFAIN